ncbi:unnamed protein product [Scytosiphon promiscuus]
MRVGSSCLSSPRRCVLALRRELNTTRVLLPPASSRPVRAVFFCSSSRLVASWSSIDTRSPHTCPLPLLTLSEERTWARFFRVGTFLGCGARHTASEEDRAQSAFVFFWFAFTLSRLDASSSFGFLCTFRENCRLRALDCKDGVEGGRRENNELEHTCFLDRASRGVSFVTSVKGFIR